MLQVIKCSQIISYDWIIFLSVLCFLLFKIVKVHLQYFLFFELLNTMHHMSFLDNPCEKVSSQSAGFRELCICVTDCSAPFSLCKRKLNKKPAWMSLTQLKHINNKSLSQPIHLDFDGEYIVELHHIQILIMKMVMLETTNWIWKKNEYIKIHKQLMILN